MSQEELQAYRDEINALRMSNELLIAELGRIAAALGVDSSMKLVLDRIRALRKLEDGTTP
jgi:hypothetical protein